MRYRCKACAKDFTVTSGTLFASHKMPLRAYLAAIAIFANEVKGKSALAISRDLGMSYKASVGHYEGDTLVVDTVGIRIGLRATSRD
jgi:hypothetical protein